MYIYGGCYADSPANALDSFVSAFNSTVTFFSSLDYLPSDTNLNSALFCSIPGHPVLYSTLMQVIKNIEDNIYSADTMGVAGPRRFAYGFVLVMKIPRIRREGG